MSAELHVKLNGVSGWVNRQHFVEAKQKQFCEFGYTHITKDEVSEQIDRLIAKKRFSEGLTIIGLLMEDEITVPQPVTDGVKGKA